MLKEIKILGCVDSGVTRIPCKGEHFSSYRAVVGFTNNHFLPPGEEELSSCFVEISKAEKTDQCLLSLDEEAREALASDDLFNLVVNTIEVALGCVVVNK